MTSQPIVETAHGRVRGRRGGGAAAFKGIRYGATTAGENRFRPPRSPEPWAGVVDAAEYGPRAPQSDPAGRFRNPAAPGTTAPGLLLSRQTLSADEGESEDCLFLNVWTGTLEPGAGRPVMVWLHGGGFNALSGSSAAYDGARLAARNGVVVVTLNHRLGALGYTELGELCGDDFAHTGNLGTLDIVAALRWVHENIGAFGGDPSRVLLFGESGGGWKVSVALATLPAAGLFHRAAIQSGSALEVAEPEDANRVAERLLAALGLSERRADGLRKLPTEAILAAQFEVEEQLSARVVPNMIAGFVPVLDAAVVPMHPFEPTASPLSEEVPVLVGFNRTEMTLFSPDEVLELDEHGLAEHSARLLGDAAVPALAAYRSLYPQASPARLLQYLHCDLTMLPFAPVIAGRHAALDGAPSFLYRFDWETPVYGGKLMSPHALEIAFVFDNVEAARALNGGGARPQTLADRLSRAWAAFAETGDPNTPESGLPPWPAYTPERPATMIFDDESHVEHDPQAEQTAIATRFVERLRTGRAQARR